MNSQKISEGLLLAYLIAGIILTMFDFPEGAYVITMVIGVGFGFMFARNHYDSIYKDKYLALLEKTKGSDKNAQG